MTGSERHPVGTREDPPSANERIAKLRLELRHLSLTELENEGIVQWDRDAHVVREGPSFGDAYAASDIEN